MPLLNWSRGRPPNPGNERLVRNDSVILDNEFYIPCELDCVEVMRPNSQPSIKTTTPSMILVCGCLSDSTVFGSMVRCAQRSPANRPIMRSAETKEWFVKFGIKAHGCIKKII